MTTTKAKRRPASKLTPLGRGVLAGLREMRAHMRGKLRLSERIVPDAIDVAAIRRRHHLSQADFAARFGLDLRAVQDWEQGRRSPDRAARVLLTIIDREPDAVDRALRAA